MLRRTMVESTLERIASSVSSPSFRRDHILANTSVDTEIERSIRILDLSPAERAKR